MCQTALMVVETLCVSHGKSSYRMDFCVSESPELRLFEAVLTQPPTYGHLQTSPG